MDLEISSSNLVLGSWTTGHWLDLGEDKAVPIFVMNIFYLLLGVRLKLRDVISLALLPMAKCLDDLLAK